MQSGAESPCTCEECQNETKQEATKDKPVTSSKPVKEDNGERVVDVLVHDSPPQFFQSVASPPYHVSPPPPPPGFVIAPYQSFPTGGNVEDLLGEVQSSPTIQTTYIQQNSVFMCNTRKVLQKQCCCCQKPEPVPAQNVNENGVPPQTEPPKCYVTEKNIELNYDYPRTTPISSGSPKSGEELTTTTEVASTVVFVERRIPVKPRKFDFFFRSRSAPVGDNEEPIYATVNKLPKRLRRMELANLEKEVAYKTGEPDSSIRTDITLKTDSESQAPHPDDDTSRSEREKSVAPTRPESPKAKKRKRFSLTFKKRERKRREKKDPKNQAKNGVTHGENERLIENERLNEGEVHEVPKPKHCTRHRPRNTMSSSSSGPRYKRDSYQVSYEVFFFLLEK